MSRPEITYETYGLTLWLSCDPPHQSIQEYDVIAHEHIGEFFKILFIDGSEKVMRLESLNSYQTHMIDLNSPIILWGIAAGVLGYLWSYIRALLSPVIRYFIDQKTTIVNISGNSQLYNYLITSLASHIESDRGRFEVGSVATVKGSKSLSRINQLINSQRIRVFDQGFMLNPGHGFRILRINGTLMFVWLSKRNLEHSGNGGGYNQDGPTKTIEENASIWVPFSGPDAVVKLLQEGKAFIDSQKRDNSQVEVYRPEYDYWQSIGDIKPRPIESVFLNDDSSDKIANTIDDFFKSEDWYAKRGIPYRMGVLLDGPPGTGKTSIIGALAGKFRTDVYKISLSSQALTDSSLTALFQAIPKNSFLVLEDIDRVNLAKKESEKDATKTENLSMSGLLNAIDGIDSGSGYVLFMTTNESDKVEPALIRKGRIDHVFEFERPNRETLLRFIQHFYGEDADQSCLEVMSITAVNKITLADLQSHLLGYKDSPEEALIALKQKLHK